MKYLHHIKLSVIGLLALFVLALPVVLPTPALAQANEQAVCEGAGGTFSGGKCTTPDQRNLTDVFRQVASVLTFIVGAVAVIMLIIGGLRYAMSGGDQAAVASAKNTIMYAVIGIIVAFMAYAIVNFVLTNITG